MSLEKLTCSVAGTMFLALGICALTVGCGGSPAATQPSADSDHGHARPAHKPRTLPAAVQEIDRRGQEFLGNSPPSGAAVGELLDIVHWLPELAAETDLKRAEWEAVAAISQRLANWVGPATDQSPPARDPTTLNTELAGLRKVLEKLEELEKSWHSGSNRPG